MTNSLAAQEVPPAEQAASVETPATDDGKESAPSRREQQRRVNAGLLALLGIAIAGVGLVAITILWAGRLRRVSRRPLPPAELKEELWFLRPPKELGGQPRPPANSSGDDTAS